MIVSVIPTYFCTLGCDYCYLGDLREDKTKISPLSLTLALNDISKEANIDLIDLYGGSLSNYDIQELISIKHYCEWTRAKQCNVTLELNVSREVIDLFSDWGIGFSWNSERADFTAETLKNFRDLPKNMKSVGVVMLPSVIRKDTRGLLAELRSYDICEVAFLRYYPGKFANKRYSVTDKEYTDKLIDIIDTWKGGNYTFDLINWKEIRSCLVDGKYTPYMRENVYVNPYNQYGYVKYDPYESFVWVNTFTEWKEACRREEKEYMNKCNMCKYFGRCYAEHL